MECLVGQLDKLLTHYGSNTGLGIHMQALMELFVIEGGVSMQLLQESFVRFSEWVTHYWLRSLWEKVDMFGFQVKIAPLPLDPPRKNDDWLMWALLEEEFSEEDMTHLNRVRCHQQVLYLSDVFDARGVALDQRYLVRRQAGDTWSTLIFPKESPPARDFHV